MTSTAATTGVQHIEEERQRQIALGFTPEHDSEHISSELTAAAICFAMASDPASLDPAADGILHTYPWDVNNFDAGDDPVRCLAKAGALIAAEIDRLLGRRSTAPGDPGGPDWPAGVNAVIAPDGELLPEMAKLDHVHTTDGHCVVDRAGTCSAPKMTLVSAPDPLPDSDVRPS